MLYTVSFRLLFSNAVFKEGKEGRDRKENVIAKRNYIFIRNKVNN